MCFVNVILGYVVLYFQNYIITRICLLSSLNACINTHNILTYHILIFTYICKDAKYMIFKIFFLIFTCHFTFSYWKFSSYNIFSSYFLSNSLRSFLPPNQLTSCSLSVSLSVYLSLLKITQYKFLSKWFAYLIMFKESDFCCNDLIQFFCSSLLSFCFYSYNFGFLKIIFCWFCCCYLFFCFWFVSWELKF